MLNYIGILFQYASNFLHNTICVVNYKEFGEAVAKYRQLKGITPYELSLRIGKDTTYIYKVEKGIVNTRLSVIYEICRALEIEPEKLFMTAPSART